MRFDSLLVLAHDEVKIVDLGHARRIEELPERFDTLLQTREYRAPEGMKALL